MGILMEYYQGITEVSTKSWQLMKRNLLLCGEIVQDRADDFLSDLLYLYKENPEQEVNLYLDSPGGEIKAGLSIIDAIGISGLPVNIIVTGEAASMAAVILACGQQGRRFIFPHAKTMIHEPWVSGNLHKSASSLQNMSESLMKTKRTVNKLVAEGTGRSLEEIDEITEHDYWMDAVESIEFGLCDGIYRGFHMGGEKNAGSMQI